MIYGIFKYKQAVTETEKKRALKLAKKYNATVYQMPTWLYNDGKYPYGWDMTTFKQSSTKIADFS